MKKLATFEIDEEEITKAKKNGVNISKVCRKALIDENSKHEVDEVNTKYIDIKLVDFLKKYEAKSYLSPISIPDTDKLKGIAKLCDCTWQEVDKVWMDKKRIKMIFDLSNMP